MTITLHFYNNDFELKNYLIAFEYLNEDESYSEEILFSTINRILKEFDIRNKLLAITRDNTSSINSLVEIIQKTYLEKYKINIIDNRCVAHILSLISNGFLTYLFFISNNTKKFNNKIEDLNTKNRDLQYLYFSIKSLSSTIRSIIKAIRNNHYLKNNFRKLVIEYKSKNKSKSNLEKLILDNTTR